jgi:hypothetical protein
VEFLRGISAVNRELWAGGSEPRFPLAPLAYIKFGVSNPQSGIRALEILEGYMTSQMSVKSNWFLDRMPSATCFNADPTPLAST